MKKRNLKTTIGGLLMALGQGLQLIHTSWALGVGTALTAAGAALLGITAADASDVK